MNKDLNGKRLLSVKETAKMLGISRRTIYNQIGKKSKKRFPIKPKRIGRLVKFDIRDIENYIKSI
jgi:excisionase family DNA binding protein